MESKQQVDIVASILYILIGCSVYMCPLLKFQDINQIFIFIMFAYAGVSLGKYFLTKEYHDYEGLLSSFASLLIGFIAFFYQIGDSARNLAILLFSWIILESLIKLKKADYYHDRKNRLWLLETILLILFILMGIFTSINLNYENEVKILLLASFFFTHGILEWINPMIFYITKERRNNENSK